LKILVDKKILIAGVIGAIIVIVIVAYWLPSQAGPKLPNVRFSDFSPTSAQSIKQGGLFTISFKVIDDEQYAVPNVTVQTTFNGTSQYFSLDKPTIQISPPIGGNGGSSGTQTITVMGNNLGGLSSIGTKFTVALQVGSIVTDTRQIDVSLTQ